MLSLKSIFKKSNSFNREGLIVSHAFTCGGTEYFELDSIYNLPTQRGKAAIQIYEEVRMKCEYEDLLAHTAAVDNLFKGDIKFKELAQLKKLNDSLSERLKIAIDPDLIYKLASVVFFNKTESPIIWDAEYAKKKIALWKKHMDVNDFFLSEPMTRLMPFLKLPAVNFQSFSQVAEELRNVHWEQVLELLSQSQKKHYSETRFLSAEETLQNSANLTG